MATPLVSSLVCRCDDTGNADTECVTAITALIHDHTLQLSARNKTYRTEQ